MAEGNRPVTRIPSIFDSDDSDDGPPPTTFQPLTIKTQQRERQEELLVPADNLSSNSEDSDDPSLSLRLSNKTPTEGEEDLTGGLPEEASTSEDTGSLETEDADAKEMESTNLEMEDALEHNDNDDDNLDDKHDDMYQEDNNMESQSFVHLGVANADDLSNDEQNTSDDSEDADQPGDSSSSLVDDDMESQNEGESMAEYPQNSEAGQLDVIALISEDQETPMDTDDKGGGPKEIITDECLQEGESAEKDEEVMEVMEEKSQDSRKDEKKECQENENEMARLVRTESKDDHQDEVYELEVAKDSNSTKPVELEDDLSEVKKGEDSTSTAANEKTCSSPNSTIKGDKAEMRHEDEVLRPSDDSVVKENKERPVKEKIENPDEGVHSGVATPESESSTTTANDGLKAGEEGGCRTNINRGSVKDIFSSDDDNSTDIGLKIALSEEDMEVQSANGSKGGVGDEVQSHSRAEARNASSPSSSYPGEGLTDADKKFEVSKLSPLQGGKRVPVRVQDVYTDSEEESNKSTGGTSVGTELIKAEMLGGSETDSVDPEDQRDSTSLLDSSRASSVEPGGVSSSQLSLASSSPARSTPQLPKNWTTAHAQKKRGSMHVDMEACMKAFDAGWRREIVYRAVVDPTRSSTRADIYYYTPAGKKLRSRVEMEQYLTKNQVDFTMNNFAWGKEPLCVDEKYELIRHASAAKSQGNSQSRGKANGSPKVETPPPSVKASPPTKPVAKPVIKVQKSSTTPSLKRRPEPQSGCGGEQAKRARMKVAYVVPTPLKKENAGSVKVEEAPAHTKKESAVIVTVDKAEAPLEVETAGSMTVDNSVMSPVDVAVTTKKIINRMHLMRAFKTSESTRLKLLSSSPLSELATSLDTSSSNLRWVEPTIKPGPASKKRFVYTTRTSFVPNCSSILTPLVINSDPVQTFHCTGTCELAKGTVPSLQCIKCLCLFHPECTGTPHTAAFLIQAGGAMFLCPNCYYEHKDPKQQAWKPPKPYEPLARDPASEESESEEITMAIGKNGKKNVLNYTQVCFKPLTPPISPACSIPGPSVIGGQSTQGTSKTSEVAATVITATSKQGSGSTGVNNRDRSTKEGLQSTSPNLSGNQVVQFQSSGPGESQMPMFNSVGNDRATVRIPLPSGHLKDMPRGRIFHSSLIGTQLPIIMPKQVTQQQLIQPVTSTPILLTMSPTTPSFTVTQQEMRGSMVFPLNVQSQQVSAPILVPGTVQQAGTPNLAQSIPSNVPQHQLSTVTHQATSSIYNKMQRISLANQQQLSLKSINQSRDRDFLHELCKNYRILVHIFKYLSVTDLLRAAQVCLLWRDLAFHPSLWEITRIRNIGVRAWSSFASFLERRNTKVLDLRNLRLPNNCIGSKTQQRLSSKSSAIPQTSGKNKAGITLNHLIQISYSSSEKNRFVIKACPKGVSDVEQEEEVGESLKGQENFSGHVINTTGQEVGNNCPGRSDRKSTSVGTATNDVEMIEIDSKKTTGAEERERAGRGHQTAKRKMSFGNDANSSDLIMECDDFHHSSKSRHTKHHDAIWEEISAALGKVRCLKSVALPPCTGHTVEVFLSRCRQMASVTAADLASAAGTEAYIPTQSVFDPAYLMENPDLEALHIGSVKGFSFSTNFNFIKLRHLRTLVIRGLVGASWPYMGNDLTSLHVAPVKMFSPYTWANIGSMTKLEVLWLENGGSLNDLNICDALSHLSNLQRLCLFNFTIGPKMGNALKKLPLLRKLVVFPAPAKEDAASVSEENGHMMAMVGMLRQLEELVWMVHPRELCTKMGVSYLHMCHKNVKTHSSLTGTSASENTLWKLEDLQNILNLSLPHVRVRIVRMDSSCATIRSALETIY